MTLLPAKRLHAALTALLVLGSACFTLPELRAADHGDAPALAHDQGADIADLYFFRDPNDATRVVLIATMRGFIVPGEAVNFAIFDPVVRYRFELYNKHINLDAPSADNPAAVKGFLKKIVANRAIDVTFSKRTAVPGPAGKEVLQIPQKQTASVRLTGFPGIDKTQAFTAEVYQPTLGATPNPQVVSDLTDGVKFFAGEVDDPFFFDIPFFSRFVASVRDGTAAPEARGRDTFAGYNILSIALSLPITAVKGANGDKVGAIFYTQRHDVEMPRKGEMKGVGPFKTVDRMANPGVNVALIPFTRKNLYNIATPRDDASGRFLGTPGSANGNGIIDTLEALGTGIRDILILGGVAAFHGDLLTLDLSVPNTGTGGGDNANAGFPNGRRLQDDVIDTFLFFVNNQQPLSDGANSNDVPFRDEFPFLGLPQQPRDPMPATPQDLVDDNTQN